MKKRNLYRWGAVALTVAMMASLFSIGGLSASAAEAEEIYTAPDASNIDQLVGEGKAWSYEFAANKGTTFKPMTKDTTGGAVKFTDGAEAGDLDTSAHARIEEPWDNNVLYLVPGDGGMDAVLAFTAPKDGTVDIASVAMTRNYGISQPDLEGSDAQIAVFKNTEKIWPAGADWQSIEWEYTFPAVNGVEVKKGDVLRFVVNYGKSSFSNWGDYTEWPVKLTLKTEEEVQIPDISGITPVKYQAPTRQTWDQSEIGTLWMYEYATNKGTNFKPMVAGTIKNDRFQSDYDASGAAGAMFPAHVTDPWEDGKVFIAPGYVDTTSIDTAMTYVAPWDGVIKFNPVTVERNYALADQSNAESDADIAIFVNDKKVWPKGDSWKNIRNDFTPANTVVVDDVEDIVVAKGDKVRFVVNCGNISYANWCDYIYWPVDMDLYITDEEYVPPAPTVPTTSSNTSSPTTSSNTSAPTTGATNTPSPTTGVTGAAPAAVLLTLASAAAIGSGIVAKRRGRK